MSKYSELIGDELYDPIIDEQIENIYNIFIGYFDNITLTKLKNNDNLSVYIARLKTLLSKDKKYIYVLVNKDNNTIGITQKLSNLNWVSLQTRTSETIYNIPEQSYIPKKGVPYNTQINLVNRTQECSEYSTLNSPLKITLLHKPYKNTYGSKGNISNAIETYETIFTIDN